MIDLRNLENFEQHYATSLDVLDALKKLRPPTGVDMPPDVARWFKDFSAAMTFRPSMPDPDQLTKFGEDVEAAVSAVDNKADMALSLATKKKEIELLPSQISDGTADNQMLIWLDGEWKLLAAPETASTYVSFDGTDVKWDYVRLT